MICQDLTDLPDVSDTSGIRAKRVYKTFNYYFTILDYHPDVMNDPTYRVVKRPKRPKGALRVSNQKSSFLHIPITKLWNILIMFHRIPHLKEHIIRCIFSQKNLMACVR